MSRHGARIALLLAGSVLGGCHGTMSSRGSGPYAVGKYPFEAVAVDIGLMAEVRPDERETGVARGDRPNLFLWGLASLPIDAVVDLVLAPVDVVAWIFGCDKTWESEAARRSWERDQATLQPR